MRERKLICMLLTAAMAMTMLAACSKDKDSDDTASTGADITAGESMSDSTAETEAEVTATPTPTMTSTPTPTPGSNYEFNPHPYSATLAEWIPQDYWDSFNNMSDALRKGESTFECSSQEAYDWVMNDVIISHLMPAAGLKVTGVSNDGTVPYENGVGHIYYNMPVEDFLAREAEFEELVVDVLNSRLQDDDDDFEKIFKLYEYMEDTYVYEQLDQTGDGCVYNCFMEGHGVCIDLAGVYSYLLMEVGVDAISMGCFDDMDHEWVYVVLDGEGYHVDPTWALKSYYDGADFLELFYFMMDDDTRVYTGCAVDDLTVQLLLEFWISKTDLDLSCTSHRFDCLEDAYYGGLDEENKILYYYNYDINDMQELYYGS